MRGWPHDMPAQRDVRISAGELVTKRNANDIFEDPNEYLNKEEIQPESLARKCPEIYINIEGVGTKALIDTGSQITCVSLDWYSRHEKDLKLCERLPVVNYRVKGVTGGKPVRVKEQVFAEVSVNHLRDRLCFLVVPGIPYSVIIGIDNLREWKANIDLQLNKLRVQTPSGVGWIELMESNYTSERLISFVECENEESMTADQVLSEDNEYRLTDDEIVEKLSESQVLKKHELNSFSELLREYRNVFHKLPGRVTIYEHRIRIYEDRPFVKRSYPVPIMHREKVRIELKKMLDLGIIERSYSEYINPLVVVAKKSGDIRLVLDARFINKLIVPDHDCAQSTEVLFQKCGNSRYLSSLDLTASFWQVPLHPDSRKYTAFMHEGRTYQFTVTPYGLSTSLASLIRTLDLILKETEEFTINFVDDILCLSDLVPNHLQHLRKLFEVFQKHNMTLNFKKSKFFRNEIDFLGHRITKDGIKPQPEKIEAIKRFPIPKNSKQLKGFLGLTNYYNKFAKNYSEATTPLLTLIRKGSKWNWTDEMNTQFEKVKELFCEAMVIHHPDPKKRYYLQCDASSYAIGAVLYQISEEREERLIGFASRTMKGAELNYFTSEKELLAIVFALEKFRTFILGAKLTIRTDHKALTFLSSCKLISSRLARWILFIQTYQFEIEYIKGNENVVADTLSRYPPESEEKKKIKGNDMTMAPLAREMDEELINKLKDLATQQRYDQRVSELIDLATERADDKITVKNDILYRVEPGGSLRAYIPTALFKRLVTECHEMYGHIGPEKCYKIIREGFYISKLNRRIRQIIARCDRCQRCKVPNRYSCGGMQNIIPTGVGELLSIDFLGPLPTSKGNYKWLLVTIDAFSKYVKLYPLKAANARSTIECIFNKYIPELGKPKRIQMDHGTQFTSVEWLNKLAVEGIIPIFSSIRHPQGNIVERVNREIGRFFRTFLTEKHTSWINWIRIIESCINEVHHDTTGFSPCEIHLKERPIRFWEEWLGKVIDKFSHEQKIELVLKNIKQKGKRRADRFNSTHKISRFKLGDLVLVKALNVSNAKEKKMAKLFDLYEGPYEIKQQVGEATFVLENPRTGQERGRFHVSMFKIYLPPEESREK